MVTVEIQSITIILIKNFSDFNQTFGYIEGNQVLQSIADIIKKQVRRSDTDPPYDVDIACRYEGDKFAIILPNTPVESADIPAERIKKAVREGWQENLPEELCAKLAKKPVEITVKVGTSGFPLNGDDYQQVLKAGEMALMNDKA